jgi:hypothetical protein
MLHKKYNLLLTASDFEVFVASNNKEQIRSEKRSQIQWSEITIDRA